MAGRPNRPASWHDAREAPGARSVDAPARPSVKVELRMIVLKRLMPLVAAAGTAIWHLDTRQNRLLAALGLLLFPIVVLGALFISSSLTSIVFARKELVGLDFVRRAIPAAALVASPRTSWPTGPQFTGWLSDLATELDATTELNAVARGLDDPTVDAVELLARLRALIKLVGDTSNLILDPDIDSYYLMSLLVHDLPALIVHSRAIEPQDTAARALASRVMLFEALTSGQRSIDAVVAATRDRDLAASLRPRWDGLAQWFEPLREGLFADSASRSPSAGRSESGPFSFFPPLRYRISDFADTAAIGLDRLLEARIKRDETALVQGLLLAAIVTLLAGALSHRALRDMFGRMDDQIVFLAKCDPLTGLANRRTYQDFLETEVTRATLVSACAVHCLDLDHFKSVNDTLGHAIGDELLRQVSRRLTNNTRSSDLVSRLGGDEFAIIQTQIHDRNAATAFAERIIAVMTEPFEIEGHCIEIGASIGIAFAPEDTGDAATLLKMADIALYESKAAGRSVYRVFESSMHENLRQRQALEAELRRALAAEQFELHYQPLLDLDRNEIVGFEALLRWRHPVRGLIPPMDFIPLAEETGLIRPIGAWVLRQACLDATSWPEHMSVAVNLSTTQFSGGSLPGDVLAAIAHSGMAPSRLELEITESIILEDSETVLRILQDLKAIGARISMDDFGTGYSSLAYLQKFPFDKVKIDRSFVGGINTKDESLAIVRAITMISRSLSMQTTAEGVETDMELERLRLEGCNQVQGYLISRPIVASAIPELLDRPGGFRTAA